MKRSKEKVGIRTEKMSEEEVTRKKVRKIIAVLLLLSLTACNKHAWYGRDGRPGDAFLSLTWQVEEPTYIDAGTGAIPPVFHWGNFYKIQPGYYDLYYEGSVWTGTHWANYAWEVVYEIWEVPGENGDWYYHGADGPDNYFTIECSPYGPYVQSPYKSTEPDSKYELIEENESEVIVVQKGDGINLKITYKKAEFKNIK